MSQQPIAVNILSDDDSDGGGFTSSLPIPSKKKQRTDSNNQPNPTQVFIIDDDPTPIKKTPAAGPSSSSTPLFVAETPMSDIPKSYVPIVRCIRGGVSETPDPTKPSGINTLICLESENESEAEFQNVSWKQSETCFAAVDVTKNLEFSPICIESPLLCGSTEKRQLCEDNPGHKILLGDALEQPGDHPIEEADIVQQTGNILGPKDINKYDPNKILNVDESRGKRRTTKEEKVRKMEEKKQKKEQEKLQKAALKAEAAEKKKLQKVKQKWETGKLALKSIVAEIDTKVIELGPVGGHLLTRLSEKGLTYRITSNPIERSIVWSMNVPQDISEACPKGFEIPYVLLIHEAGEFCNLLTNEALMDHVSHVRRQYPSHTVCYLTNRLMAHINKRERDQYKDPANHSGWRRPPVEEVLSKLTTHFVGIHSRLCIDEAELAEHVVGLTCSLASCQFRKKLTRLSVNANGSLIPKDCVDKNLIKKSVWLKALVAIPKVQPRFAIAIWKKYPTMKSLLSVYMDPSKSVHEKEFQLKDLTTEGLLGENRRLGEVCSKRVYRILMAQSGSIKTDDVENGADFFHSQSS